MALSQTSLELDSLTVETLFNRGPLLSSSMAYIPILSSIGPGITNNNSYNNITSVHWGNNGASGGCGCDYEYITSGGFFQWLYLPVSNVYYNFFYSYSTPDVLLQPIIDILLSTNTLSSSLHYNIDDVIAFSNTNYSNLVLLSNIDSSTLSSYNLSYSNDSNVAVQRYTTITNTLTRDVPGLLYTSTTFTTVLFSNNASNIITIASNYYTNPGGSRNSIPGINLMSNNSLDPDSNSTLAGYSSILNSSIIYLDNSNASLDEYRSNLLNLVNSFCTILETGSSLSTLYTYSNSSFFNVISSLSSPESFFDKQIYSFSSLIDSYFTSYIVPTNGPYISTGYSTLVSQELSSYSTVLGYVSSGTISTPIVVFSNIISTLIQSTNSTIARYNYITGFSTINFRFSTIVKPLTDPLFVSTNIYGYINLSTSIIDIFSSISSSLPYLVGDSILDSLSSLTGNISSLSTSIILNNSTIIGLTNSYITGPGISSLSTQFSLDIDSFNKSYEIASNNILYLFQFDLNNVNSIPGLSSLYDIGSITDYIVSNQIGIIYEFVNITYPLEQYNFFFNPTDINYVSVSTGISTNIGTYINDGVVAYSTSLFLFSNISTNTYDSINFLNLYTQISQSPDQPTGYAYQTFSSLNLLQENTLNIISTLEGSNLDVTMLEVINHYSTDVSPTFNYIQTSSFSTQTSDYNIKKLFIKTSPSPSVFEVNGSVSIMPYSPDIFAEPSINLPNFYIYARDDPVINSTINSLSARFSSIIFNEGGLTIKHIYNSSINGLIGINNLHPEYALDIGSGNARKLSGTTWINPSDRRIKHDIRKADPIMLTREISSLRLVQYTWKQSYATSHGLGKTPTLGFISQEVESIYPNSVVQSKEAGFTDFRTLDTDQIFKAKFGLTQQLLYRASTLQSRIDALLQGV